MAEGEWYDPKLKENALRLVQSGMTASQVAREFGLPCKTVQKWARLAMEPKNYPGKQWVVDKSQCKANGKVYKYKGSFTAYDKHKRPHVILLFRREEDNCSVTEETSTIPLEWFLTVKRQLVHRIRKGLYKLRSGVILESDDPDVP